MKYTSRRGIKEKRNGGSSLWNSICFLGQRHLHLSFFWNYTILWNVHSFAIHICSAYFSATSCTNLQYKVGWRRLHMSTAVNYGALTGRHFYFTWLDNVSKLFGRCKMFTLPVFRIRMDCVRIQMDRWILSGSRVAKRLPKRKIEEISCFKVLSKGLESSPGSCTLFIY